MRRTLSWLLTLCLVISMSVTALPVKAAKITNGLDFTTGENKSGDGYSWEDSTKILTLNGIDIQTADFAAIIVPDGTTIKLTGTNTVKSMATQGYSYGIFGLGKLNIQGPGTLNVDGGNVSFDPEEEYGESCGIITLGTITFSNCTVNATSGTVTGEEGESVGVFAYEGQIVVSSSRLNVSAKAATDYSCGLFTYGSVAMNSGTIVAKGEDCAIVNENPISLPASYRYKTNTVANMPAGDYISVPGGVPFGNKEEYKYVEITTFTAVTGITGVVSTAAVGKDVVLGGTVVPANATNTSITWIVKDAGVTGAKITNNILSTTATGAVVVTATVKNGGTETTDYTKDFTITVQGVPVTKISGVKTKMIAGKALALSGTVAPSNATNKTITWSIANKGKTKATLSGNKLKAKATGTVIVRATVKDGKALGQNYVQNFKIKVTAYFAKTKYKGSSFVAALKKDKIGNTLANRKKIAKANGVKKYSGAKKQDAKLLNLLKKGKLIK